MIVENPFSPFRRAPSDQSQNRSFRMPLQSGEHHEVQ
jgi:hypothetical protein